VPALGVVSPSDKHADGKGIGYLKGLKCPCCGSDVIKVGDMWQCTNSQCGNSWSTEDEKSCNSECWGLIGQCPVGDICSSGQCVQGGLGSVGAALVCPPGTTSAPSPWTNYCLSDSPNEQSRCPTYFTSLRDPTSGFTLCASGENINVASPTSCPTGTNCVNTGNYCYCNACPVGCVAYIVLRDFNSSEFKCKCNGNIKSILV
jgi:hypothetical protein